MPRQAPQINAPIRAALHQLQDPQPRRRTPRPTDGTTPPAAGQGFNPGGQAGGAVQQVPFADAIKDYTKSEGVFTIYQKDDSVLVQIPKSMLNRTFLWSIEQKESPSGEFSGTTVGRVLVTFQQRGNKVWMRKVDFRTRSTNDPVVAASVAASNSQPIVEAFALRSKADDGSPLIDFSRFMIADVPELGISRSLGGSVDAQRSVIDKVMVFPENLNFTTVVTVRAGAGGAAAGGGGGRFGAAVQQPSNTSVLHHSIVLLPEKPMMGRLGDSRVGYFSDSFTDFGTDYHGAKEREFIARYRLEKKDPKAAVSEPVKPIVYYVTKEVPDKWKPYVKQGIEDWQGAFEQAGFKQAIIAKDQPDDPNWSPEDVRYSVIRWAPLPIKNAVGPHTSDPRSGEIMSAHVIVWHDILKLQTEWYFSQAAATDPRVARLPIPDEIMGQMIRFVVSHEVGHTLGLPHNGKSSGMIPIAKLRDPKWTAENGVCTSIMDYARFNYVAQPGDKAALMPKIGRYDRFAIEWGYKPLGANKPEDETRALDAMASRQVTDPELRFYDNFNPNDPTAQSESLGDDVVEASRLGVLNLKRIVPMLMPATSKLGEDYSELQRMHEALISQMTRYCLHVATAVGGSEQVDYHDGRGGEVYKFVPADYQRRAVAWLCANALTPPKWLAPRDIVTRTSTDGGFRVLSRFQTLGVAALLNNNRIALMAQNEALNGDKAYRISEMMQAVRQTIWSETATAAPQTDLYRRNLQRIWVSSLVDKLSTPSSEVRTYALSELRAADRAIRLAEAKAKDSVTAAHYGDLRQTIKMALENPPAVAADTTTASPFGPRSVVDELVAKDPKFWSQFQQHEVDGHWYEAGCTFGG